MIPRLRFAVVALLLLSTGVYLKNRSQKELIPPRTTFSSFPYRLGDWTGTPIEIPDDVIKVLGAGDFLLRDYQAAKQAAVVNLFMAYIPTQRTGDTIHSPSNCLPGTGWWPVESRKIVLNVPGQPSFVANRYLVAKGNDREIVVYWYWAHGRAESSEYTAKYYLIADSLRLHRSDGALIRLSTPILSAEAANTAQGRIIDLARNVVSVIDAYIPR